MKTKQSLTTVKELSVGGVAKRTGVAISAIHFYEVKGLITSRRNQGNQRRYTHDVLRRIAIIKVAQKMGVSLQEIAAAFKALPRQRTPTKKDWDSLSRQWKESLDVKIRLLTHLRDDLSECIGCGCLSIDSCPLRNPDDVLSSKGSGPILFQ
ncbi:Redox-sensitive transcriptional activator SoxR [gamma proteobacterium IMCC1989]|nr:Redox-sensitive transcriptional activator SoxR [gamma proteobacterium IMCC1989]